MNNGPFLKASLPALLLSLSGAAFAQTTDFNQDFVPVAGAHEITLGGGGGATKELDDSFAGFNGSYGTYLSETWEVVLRQSVNYSNPGNGGIAWNGSTFVAADYHFSTRTKLRPFVGVNAGRIYGDGVDDTWAAGLEAGVKYYVQPRAFLYALAQYAFTFEERDEINDQFSEGQVLWTVGVGFNL